jgi:hypothetical protein
VAQRARGDRSRVVRTGASDADFTNFSPKWLSAAFDANVAPFYQSFIEVRVDSSTKRIRLKPYGVNDRLRWDDLEASRGVRPAGVPADAQAEWVVGMP